MFSNGASEHRHLAFGSHKAGVMTIETTFDIRKTTGVVCNISGVLSNIVLIGKNVSFISREAVDEASNLGSEQRHLAFGIRKAGVMTIETILSSREAGIQKHKVFMDFILDNSTVGIDVFKILIREICCTNSCSKCAGYCYCQKGLNQCLLHLRNP